MACATGATAIRTLDATIAITTLVISPSPRLLGGSQHRTASATSRERVPLSFVRLGGGLQRPTAVPVRVLEQRPRVDVVARRQVVRPTPGVVVRVGVDRTTAGRGDGVVRP